MNNNKRLLRGQSLVELLFAIAFAGIVLPALLTAFVSSREGKAQQQQRIDAVALMKEGEEAVRVVRERGWIPFAVDGTYHPVASASSWTLSPGVETVNGYIRRVDISSVYRESASGAIVTSGGVLDVSTKKVVASVSWTTPNPSSASATMYVTRYLDNLAYTETTAAQFNLGIKTLTNVTNTSGGEIVLGTNTKGQWCSPQLSIASVGLPDKPNALFATEGNIYVATGQTTNASQVSFAHVLVTNTDPPTSSVHGLIKGFKTTSVFGEPAYGYITTTSDTKEVVIINLNLYDDAPNKILHQEGWFNTTTNTNSADTADGNSVFVMKDANNQDRGYVAAGKYLYVFDLSSKTGSRPRVGTRIQFVPGANTGTAGQIYGRVISGHTYIFIAIVGNTPEEIKIADVTNPNNINQWKIVGGLNIEPNGCSSLESGKAVYVNPEGTRAYISSTNDAHFKEFFVVDTTNKTSPILLGGLASNPPCTNGGGYEASGMDPTQSAIAAGQTNRAILVGTDATGDSINSVEYQVLDLTNEGHPTYCGGLQFDQGVYGVAAVKEADGDAYTYIITGDTNAELKIIQGGPDGIYLDSGTFESAILDVGYDTVFNRLSATTTMPALTDIKFQIALANAVSGSCSGASYNYVGPDGTASTYFSSSGGTIPQNSDGNGYENPGRCMRYKAFLSTTDYNATPVVNDVSVNYSP